jgi:hypothetical protein
MALRADRIDDLPESLRQQAREKLGVSCNVAKDLKYHNIRTEADGHVFPSRHEAERYGELKLMYQAREISSLMIQVPFPLAGGLCYIADFVYYDIRRRRFVVEDAKGVRTKEYVMKKKLMKEIGIEIEEV